jgi:hypothetical protein
MSVDEARTVRGSGRNGDPDDIRIDDIRIAWVP